MKEVLERAKEVRLLLLDVDGVLTDGSIILDGRGGEWKVFYVRDGTGIKMLMASGIEVAILTGRTSEVVRRRAEELTIHRVYQGVRDKTVPYEELKAELGLGDHQVCFIGDDVVDVPLLRRVGLPVAVADASEEAKAAALYVTRNPGGRGAVREVCELILKAQGKWRQLVESF